MSQQIELTAEQLSTLDQIIAQKQKGDAFITDTIGDPVTAELAVITVTQVIGGALSTEDLANSPLKEVIKNIPVDKLIEVRKNAVQKK